MKAERRAAKNGTVGSGEKNAISGDPMRQPGHLALGDASMCVPLALAKPRDSVVENACPGSGGVEVGRAAHAATPLLANFAAFDGEVREVSVVMADLRGFTTFCEQVPPGRMSRVLNEYLTAMIDVILGQHGHVQDFVGDGILGIFGAPRQDPAHAWHAVLSALEMQLAIRWLNGRWEQEGGPTFALGVAVHTGEAFAGTVGSQRQRKFAVVGDPVNTAARLEELNRNLGTEIVISGDTLALVRDRVDVCPRGSFAVRGRSHSVEVFELVGIQGALAPAAGNGAPAKLSLA